MESIARRRRGGGIDTARWDQIAPHAEGASAASTLFGHDRDGESAGQSEQTLLEARTRIRSLVSIAAKNGSSVSTQELHALLPDGLFKDADSVGRFVSQDESLRQELGLEHGEVFPQAAPLLGRQRPEQRKLSAERMLQARSFAARLDRACPGVELLAISGSTAFWGAKPDDDLDFFLVARANRMWVTLLAAMGAAKLERLRDPRTPTFCFNRVTESEPCLSSFARPGDTLFAREALSLKVIQGRGFFHRLLGSAAWMDRHFPTLDRRSLMESEEAPEPVPGGGSAGWSLANFASLFVLAPYLWLTALVRNRRLQRQGRTDALFRTEVHLQFFSYESRKFEELRRDYTRAL